MDRSVLETHNGSSLASVKGNKWPMMSMDDERLTVSGFCAVLIIILQATVKNLNSFFLGFTIVMFVK